jgi:hypothetical protein
LDFLSVSLLRRITVFASASLAFFAFLFFSFLYSTILSFASLRYSLVVVFSLLDELLYPPLAASNSRNHRNHSRNTPAPSPFSNHSLRQKIVTARAGHYPGATGL